jgi:excisionase family DNA binding protein
MVTIEGNQSSVAWLSAFDAASYAGLSVITITRAARRGRLRAVKVNAARVWRFRREWIDQWLQQPEHQEGR